MIVDEYQQILVSADLGCDKWARYISVYEPSWLALLISLFFVRVFGTVGGYTAGAGGETGAGEIVWRVRRKPR